MPLIIKTVECKESFLSLMDSDLIFKYMDTFFGLELESTESCSTKVTLI